MGKGEETISLGGTSTVPLAESCGSSQRFRVQSFQTTEQNFESLHQDRRESDGDKIAEGFDISHLVDSATGSNIKRSRRVKHVLRRSRSANPKGMFIFL